MSEVKRAQPDYPIDDLIAERWSPYISTHARSQPMI